MNIQNRFEQEVYLENTERRFSEQNLNPELSVHISLLLSGEEVSTSKLPIILIA